MSKFLNNFKPIDLPWHGVRCPKVDVDIKVLKKLGLSEDSPHEEVLLQLCRNGFREIIRDKVPKEKEQEYADRVKTEFEVLKKLNFVDYILLVWDVINFCQKEDIPTGPGRGSAAGSLILYLIGVTKIDPIKYNLFFERFVSEVRAKSQIVDGITYLDGSLMCDIDLDIDYYKRQRVVDYLDQKFPKKTCKILTFNTLQGKALVKECGKIISERDEDEMNMVSSLIRSKYGKNEDITVTRAEVPLFEEWCQKNELAYQVALKLRGLIRNKSVHASGVIVSYDEVNNTIPTELSSDKNEVTSFDMEYSTELNIKLDLLGLRSLSVVDETCKMLGISMQDIDFEDENIYINLQNLKSPHGLFQLEADTNFKVCQEVKPKNLDELSAVVALARPGALDFVDQYSKYVNYGEYQNIEENLDKILVRTGGVALYQEQMMQIGNKVFGFTLDESEMLRRIVGKKKVKEMPAWKSRVYEQAEKLKLTKEVADLYWKILEDSANYSFNAAHSAAYAALSAMTIYLKFNHPKEFFCSLLRMTTNESDPLEEISKISQELQDFGIKLLPPSFSKSEENFKLEGSNIRYGLSSIKNISKESVSKIEKFKEYNFENKVDCFSIAKDCGVGIGILSSLIQAGTFESIQHDEVKGFPQSRSKLVLEAQLFRLLTERERILITQLFENKETNDIMQAVRILSERKKPTGKAFEISPKRFETIKSNFAPYREIYEKNSKNERFANWFYETKLLGYSYSETLKDIFKYKNPNIRNIKEVKNSEFDTKEVIFMGIVTESFSRKSAKGNKYYKCVVKDESGDIGVMIFDKNKQLDNCKQMNGGTMPKKGNIVGVRGTPKDNNTVFADLIMIQDNKIYMKLSELKS